MAFIFVALSLGTHKIPKVKICLYHMQNSGKQNKTELSIYWGVSGGKDQKKINKNIHQQRKPRQNSKQNFSVSPKMRKIITTIAFRDLKASK